MKKKEQSTTRKRSRAESGDFEKKIKLTNESTTDLKSMSSLGAGIFPSPTPKFSAIRKTVLQHLHNNQYDELRQYLSSNGFLTEENISKFLSKESDIIWISALCDAKDDKQLKFLKEIVPEKTLKDLLMKDNFTTTLKYFLYMQLSYETRKTYITEIGKMQIEKFKVLLSIDSDAIKDLMSDMEDVDNRFQTAQIKQNFAEAVKQFENENKPVTGVTAHI